MTSYYKTIRGIKYDKAMIEAADNSVKGKKDGRISINDAKKIIKNALDGAGITDVESRTIQYIYDNYNFTPSAMEYFSDYLPKEEIETISEKKVKKEGEDDVEETVTEIKGFFSRYYLLIVIIALILFLLYLYSDRLVSMFSKGTKPDEPVQIEMTDKDDDKIVQLPEEVIAADNEYIVKEKDTLFDISGRIYGDPGKWEELYERNKDVLESPSMIFPGQKIRTDLEEKQQ
jgi:nucleoid-associated protein YgaU